MEEISNAGRQLGSFQSGSPWPFPGFSPEFSSGVSGKSPGNGTLRDEEFLLVLDDGREFSGRGFGSFSGGWIGGEVVFNTAVTGYQEVLTDPSYTGQLVVFTGSHIGNYGCTRDWDEMGHSPGFAAGAVLRSLHDGPLPAGRTSLGNYMQELGIGGITEVDTRALTLHLRNGGSRNGIILPRSEGSKADEILSALPSMEGRPLAREQGTREMKPLPGGDPRLSVGVIDFGAKDGIIRELQRCGASVTLLPSSCTAAEILAGAFSGLLLSNGPGDPAVLDREIGLVSNLLGRVPLFGICLGHQLLGLALGGKTRKMPFGHHGVNHPVKELSSGRVFVSSQNHGFEVLASSLPGDVEISFINTNDGTLEGLSHGKSRAWSVQFHPEASPGPREASQLFDRWIGTLR